MCKFIVVEGLDGSGKTTQSKALAKALGGNWMCFPERRTFYGKLIDAWLKGLWSAQPKGPDAEDWEASRAFIDAHGKILDGAVFQALQTLNRLELAKFIEHIKTGARDPLVCDRYWMSGYAYGSADGLDSELMVKVHTLLPEPDLCLLIDCPVEVVEARMKARNDPKADRYEKMGQAYFTKVYAAYDELWRLKGAVDKRWVRIPSTGAETFEETQSKLLAVVRSISGG